MGTSEEEHLQSLIQTKTGEIPQIHVSTYAFLAASRPHGRFKF
jgi:hypothetical protein